MNLEVGILSFGVVMAGVVLVACLLVFSHLANKQISRFHASVVIIAWFLASSVVYLIPIDILIFSTGKPHSRLVIIWTFFYWIAFLFNLIVLPLSRSYFLSGHFTSRTKFKGIFQEKLQYIAIGLIIGLVAVIWLGVTGRVGKLNGYLGVLSALNNLWGISIYVFVLGFGLVEVPKRLWFLFDFDYDLARLYHQVVEADNDKKHALEELFKDLSTLQAYRIKLESDNSELQKSLRLQRFIAIIEAKFPEEVKTSQFLERNCIDQKKLKKSEITEEVLAAIHSNVILYSAECIRATKFLTSLFAQIMKINGGNIGDLDASAEQIDSSQFLPAWKLILKYVCRFLALLAAALSILILWGQLTLDSSQEISPILIVVQMFIKKPIVVQLATFIPLSYICICSFLSLFRLKMSVNYRLHTGQITPTLSLLDNAANFLNMNFPLGQNFLKLIGIRHSAYATAIKAAELVPILGNFVVVYFPVLISVVAFMTAFNLFSFISKYIAAAQYLQDESSDVLVKEGKMIVMVELRKQKNQQYKSKMEALKGTSTREMKSVRSLDVSPSSTGSSSREISVKIHQGLPKQQSAVKLFAKLTTSTSTSSLTVQPKATAAPDSSVPKGLRRSSSAEALTFVNSRTGRRSFDNSKQESLLEQAPSKSFFSYWFKS